MGDGNEHKKRRLVERKFGTSVADALRELSGMDDPYGPEGSGSARAANLMQAGCILLDAGLDPRDVRWIITSSATATVDRWREDRDSPSEPKRPGQSRDPDWPKPRKMRLAEEVDQVQKSKNCSQNEALVALPKYLGKAPHTEKDIQKLLTSTTAARLCSKRPRACSPIWTSPFE